MYHFDVRYSKLYKKSNIKGISPLFLDEKMDILTVEGGVILANHPVNNKTYGLGGVLDVEGRFVKESGFSLCMYDNEQLDWGGSYSYDEKQLLVKREKVIFGGFINNNEWGHFLVDWCTRLWYALIDQESKIVFCIRGNVKYELLPNIEQLIQLSGINTKRIELIAEGEPPIKYDTIAIPQCSLTSRGYTKEYLDFFNRIVNNVSGLDCQTYEKIYFTRTQLESSKEIGESKLERFFEKNGYKVLAPEKLSAVEQIHYISNCKYMACIEGSAAHNIIFGKEGTRLYILEKWMTINIRQLFLSQASGSDTCFIMAYPTFLPFREYFGELFVVGTTKMFRKWAKENYGQKVECKTNWLRQYIQYFDRIMQKIAYKLINLV